MGMERCLPRQIYERMRNRNFNGGADREGPRGGEEGKVALIFSVHPCVAIFFKITTKRYSSRRCEPLEQVCWEDSRHYQIISFTYDSLRLFRLFLAMFVHIIRVKF